ncbi:MAG: DUF47 family protein [Acidobacteriota bacterium]
MKFIGKTKELITEIDVFCDTISRSSLVFKSGINNFLEGKTERFHIDLEEINKLENEADNLRREIKYKLYIHMLIPDSRGDVLGLLETSDNVVDSIKKVLSQFDIEKPDIPKFLKDDFRQLAQFSVDTVDEMVKASRAFFREISLVNDHINKVHYYEHEADKIEEELKRKVFNSTEIKSLSEKVQLRYFAERVALISDEAEAVGDRLSIYVIKRTR